MTKLITKLQEAALLIALTTISCTPLVGMKRQRPTDSPTTFMKPTLQYGLPFLLDNIVQYCVANNNNAVYEYSHFLDNHLNSPPIESQTSIGNRTTIMNYVNDLSPDKIDTVKKCLEKFPESFITTAINLTSV